MPIEVAHSPNLGLVGAGAFYAGAGNPDDAAKRAQIALQRDQMNTEAQFRNAQLAQQADQFSMGQEYDLYKQLASMANNNAQLQYRTQADNDQLQYRTQAEDAARYNAQMNDNAQLEYRTQAAQADRQAGMANENMQMTYQQQSRKEMMDLQQQYEMARLNHTEELHMGRLQKGLANLDVMLGSGEIDEEGHANLTAQLTNGLTPFQKRAAEAQQLQMDLKSKQMEIEIRKNTALASEIEGLQNDSMPKNSRWVLNDSNLDMTGTYTLGGKLHELGTKSAGGGSRSSGAGGGDYSGNTGPAEKPMPIEPPKPFPAAEVAATAEKYADTRVSKTVVENGKEVGNPQWQKEYDDYTTMRQYNWEKEQHLHRQQIEEAQVRSGERLPKGYGTFQALPQMERALILKAAEDQAKDEMGQVGLYAQSGDEYTMQFRDWQKMIALKMAKDKWQELAPNAERDAASKIGPWGPQQDADFMSRHPGWSPPAAPAGTPTGNPTGSPQGRMGPVAPDPITPEREIGVKGAKPLTPEQEADLATLGKMTIDVWGLDKPIAEKEKLAKDTSEAIALFKKYGSADAVKASPDGKRWDELSVSLNALKVKSGLANQTTAVPIGDPSLKGGTILGVPTPSGKALNLISQHLINNPVRTSTGPLGFAYEQLLGSGWRGKGGHLDKMVAEGLISPQAESPPKTAEEARMRAMIKAGRIKINKYGEVVDGNP